MPGHRDPLLRCCWSVVCRWKVPSVPQNHPESVRNGIPAPAGMLLHMSVSDGSDPVSCRVSPSSRLQPGCVALFTSPCIGWAGSDCRGPSPSIKVYGGGWGYAATAALCRQPRIPRHALACHSLMTHVSVAYLKWEPPRDTNFESFPLLWFVSDLSGAGVAMTLDRAILCVLSLVNQCGMPLHCSSVPLRLLEHWHSRCSGKRL